MLEVYTLSTNFLNKRGQNSMLNRRFTIFKNIDKNYNARLNAGPLNFFYNALQFECQYGVFFALAESVTRTIKLKENKGL